MLHPRARGFAPITSARGRSLQNRDLQNRCTTTVLTRRGGLVSEFCGLCQSLLSGAGLGHPTKSAALVPGIVPARVPYLFMARCRCSVIRWLYRIVMATVL